MRKTSKSGNSIAAHAQRLLPILLTNELGLKNCVTYLGFSFGENRRKNEDATVDEMEN